MDCCGHVPMRHAWMSGTTLVPIGVMLDGGAGPLGSTAAAETAEVTAAALGMLRTSISVDVHIRACHRLGFVCDVAHATEDMVKQAVKVATKPLLLSHTALSGSRAMGPTPLGARQISSDHALAIAETGGSVGIWHFFPTLDRYVEGLKEMAEIVGIDHVSIGTDQHVTPGSVADYTSWVHLVAAMLHSGFTPEESGKIAGGNYMRIFRAAVG